MCDGSNAVRFRVPGWVVLLNDQRRIRQNDSHSHLPRFPYLPPDLPTSLPRFPLLPHCLPASFPFPLCLPPSLSLAPSLPACLFPFPSLPPSLAFLWSLAPPSPSLPPSPFLPHVLLSVSLLLPLLPLAPSLHSFLSASFPLVPSLPPSLAFPSSVPPPCLPASRPRFPLVPYPTLSSLFARSLSNSISNSSLQVTLLTRTSWSMENPSAH